MDTFPFKKDIIPSDTFLNALADAYRLQESIIGATELSIISTNVDGIITSFNRAAERLTGHLAEDVIGKATPMILHETSEVIQRADELSAETGMDIAPVFDVFTTKARLTREADRREWTYVRKDGTHFPVLLSITGLWDDHDNLIGFAGIATDITEQKIADYKIKQSEAHLQALLNSIDDIVLEVDKRGVFTNIWTKKESLLFAFPREVSTGKRLEDVLSGDLLQQYKGALAYVLTTQLSVNFEYFMPGGENWCSVKISFINSERVLILIRTITEKKNSELLLAQSEQKFRTLAENVPGAIFLCKNDEVCTMLYLNDKVKEITGYSADEFLSGQINFTQLYHPEDRQGIFNTVDKALETRKKYLLEYRIRHQNGEWRWVEEIGTGVYDGNTLDLIEGFISDITAQKQAERELQKVAEENYRLFNNAVTLNVIAGFDGYFKRLNPTWQSLLGWTDEELKSRPLSEYVHPEDLDSTQYAITSLLGGNHLLSFENRYRCKDGTYRWLLWGLATDLKNQLIYASAIDITDRKRSEEALLRSKQNLEAIALKLQEQNRQLDEFAHIISHNLRSPVGNIKALIGLLNADSTVSDYRQIFDKLKNVANNLGETMNELMETLKVKKDTAIERVDIRFKEIFDKVVQSMEGELILNEAEVTFNFNEAPSILYSKAYLESIFQNLLNNAIKYRSQERKPIIEVTTSLHNDTIVLRVADNGQGIDMKKYGDKLFGLHKTFHEHKDARGVGLFLVKTQIEALGGSITAESEVNKGTTFLIRF